MRADPQASPDDLDVTFLWSALRRNGVKLLLTGVMIAALTYGFLSLLTPRYTSEAQIALSGKVDKEALDKHVKALMAPDLAGRIADEMKLAEKKEFNSALGSEDVIDELARLVGASGPRPGESTDARVLAAFLRKLDVYMPKDNRYIGVRFTSSNPQLAAEIANKLSETYVASLGQGRGEAAGEVQPASEPRIAELVSEVAKADAEIERLRGEVDAAPQTAEADERRLGELTAQQSRASAVRSEAEARARSAREMAREGNAEALSEVQKSPLIQDLVQQRVRTERQISELSATLLPTHPQMKQLTANLGNLKRQIALEADKVVEGIESQAKAAGQREDEIVRSIEALKKKVADAGDSAVKLADLEAAAKSKRAALEQLRAQFEAEMARGTEAGGVPEAQILNKARVAGAPSFPRKGPFAALVMLATLLFGTVWIVANALWQGPRPQHKGFDRPVRDTTSAPFEPVEPMLPAQPKAAVAEDVPSGAATLTSIPELARRLARCKHGASGYRVLISSDDPSIDPAQEALALARRLAQADASVILIDWSRDGNGIARQIGMPTAPGFTELLAGRASFEQVVRRLPESPVHFIPAGAAAPAQGVMDPDFLNMLLDALDEAYDQIIIAGRSEPARILFHTVEGRFDAGIAVVNAASEMAQQPAAADRFLGFAVSDIEIVRFARPKEAARARAVPAESERPNLSVSPDARSG